VPIDARRRMVGPGRLLRPTQGFMKFLEKSDTNHVLTIWLPGPWNHEEWNRATGQVETSILEAASQYFRANILRPWFAYYLKDKGSSNNRRASDL